MRILRESRKSLTSHGEPVILFAIGPHGFAISADDVDEIRDMQGLQSIAKATAFTAIPKVKFTLTRNRKSYFVVDGNLHFAMLPSKSTRVLVLRNLMAAVLVDSIDRMAEISAVLPLPQSFQGAERRWYRGLTVLDGNVVPVVNAGAFLTAAEQVTAAAVAARLAKEASA